MYVEEQRKIEKKKQIKDCSNFEYIHVLVHIPIILVHIPVKKPPTKQLAKQTCLFHKAKRPIKRPLSGLQEKNFFENNIFKLVYDIIS